VISSNQGCFYGNTTNSQKLSCQFAINRKKKFFFLKKRKERKKNYRRKRMKSRIQSCPFDAYCQYVVKFYSEKKCSEVKISVKFTLLLPHI